MTPDYRRTRLACYLGYIVQAIVNNFAPLLFVHFSDAYGIPLTKITLLVTLNFGVQLCVDLASTVLVDRIGYRASAYIAHSFSAAGLLMLAFLPDILPDPYIGILISVITYAIGGGLLEVVISPIIEACPAENKEKQMSILHSFYCWGQVGVTLVSTGFFALFGIGNFRILSVIFAVLAIANMILFGVSPLCTLNGDGEKGMSIRELFSSKIFYVFLVMMLASGASEQAVSQWASSFAERGLGVSKAVGDLAGPMAFAFLMGVSRLIYGGFGHKLNMKRFMMLSTVLCVISYCCIVFVPDPVVGLLGCAVSGFAVGIMWPGTYSLASARLPGGGTAMFALLALAGDIGCTSGPTLAGLVSGAAGDDFRAGILAATVFPLMMLVCLLIMKKKKKTA